MHFLDELRRTTTELIVVGSIEVRLERLIAIYNQTLIAFRVIALLLWYVSPTVPIEIILSLLQRDILTSLYLWLALPRRLLSSVLIFAPLVGVDSL